MDKRYDKHNFLIHDYFFAKTIDKVRPGGVIAFVTSSGTMDKRNSNVRKYIAQRADLIGAIRLPDNTFKANAGTEVTSDILFLEKRDRMTDIEPDWVHLGTDENGHTKFVVQNGNRTMINRCKFENFLNELTSIKKKIGHLAIVVIYYYYTMASLIGKEQDL